METDRDMTRIRREDMMKLKKYRIQDTRCIYTCLSLKLLINTLLINTKINIIYLSNIQYTKNNDNIIFVSYFNGQNHVKDKKIFFKFNIVCFINIIQVSVSDSYGHAIYEKCRSMHLVAFSYTSCI